MQIRTLRLRPFKGLSSHLECHDFNLLVGPNRTGKTAHAQAIQFAVSGATDLGATLEATQQLGGPGGCCVEVELDDGFSWSRLIRREPRAGALSATVQIRGQEGLPVKDANSAILEHVGDFAPMLDIGAFLTLSADKRRDFVLWLCSRAQGTPIVPATVWDQIVIEFCRERLGAGTVDALRSEGGQVTAQIVAKLRDIEQGALIKIAEELLPELKGDLSVSIAAALDRAKQISNDSKAQADGAAKASRTLADRREQLQTIAESAESMREGIAELRNRKEALAEQIGKIEGLELGKRDLTERIEEMARTERHWKGKLAELGTKPGPALQRRIGEVELAERAAREAVEATGGVTDQLVSDFEGEHREAEMAYDMATRLVSDLKHRSQNKKDTLERERSDPWRVAHDLIVETELKEGLHLVGCIPWTRLRALVAEYAQADHRPDLMREIRELGGQIREAAQNVAKAQITTFDAGQKVERNRRLLHANRDLEAKAGTLRLKADDLTRQLKDAEQARASAEQHLSQCTEDRVALERQLGSLIKNALGGCSADELRSQQGALASEIEATEGRIAAKEDEGNLVRELNRCIAYSEAQRVLHDCCKGVANAIRVLRERLMVELIRPLLDRIDRFMEHGEPGSRAYCTLVNARGRPIFEMGVVQNGDTKVSLPAMSGGQSCLFCTALLYALLDMADPPLKLLIVEVDRADSATFKAIADAIEHVCVGDAAPQVFLLTHRYPIDRPWHAWTIEDLSDRRPAPSQMADRSPAVAVARQSP